MVGGTGAGVSVVLTETATYQGSDADEEVINQSSGVVDMGAGNDTVLGVEGGASAVYGGAGDDVIEGSLSVNSYMSSATYLLSYKTSFDVDTLDGGAGNDIIRLSHGDLVTTGTGSDNLSLGLLQNAAYGAADITDFDPALDQMVIYFGSFDAYSMPEPLANTIAVTETSAGDTVISSTNGQVLARLTGVTGLSVGLQLVEGDPLTDLAGVPTPDATYDVKISRFYEPSS